MTTTQTVLFSGIEKTIHDLKKQVKTLETRLAVHGATELVFEDDAKATKAKKK